MTTRILSKPRLPAVPRLAARDASEQRVHDAIRETLETIRGSRGNPLDRAIFLRDLVNLGFVKPNGAAGNDAVDVEVPIDDHDPTIPEALTGVAFTVGFTSVLFTWNPHPGQYVEVRRLAVTPAFAPGAGAGDVRATPAEVTAYAGGASNFPTPAAYAAMGVLVTESDQYDDAYAAWVVAPPGAEKDAAYAALQVAEDELFDARIAYNAEAQQETDPTEITDIPVIAHAPSTAYVDVVEGGKQYWYYLRPVSRSGVPGPFTPGYLVEPQRDPRDIIAELSDDAIANDLTDLLLNGLDLETATGVAGSLSQRLSAIAAQAATALSSANQAMADAANALASASTAIPPAVWDGIQQQLAALAALQGQTYNNIWTAFLLHDEQDGALATVQQTAQTLTTQQLATASLVTALGAELGSAQSRISVQETVLATTTASLSLQQQTLRSEFEANKAEVDVFRATTATELSALATEQETLTAQVYDNNAAIVNILALNVSPTSALLTRLNTNEATAGSALSKANSVLNLTADYNGSALANQISQISTTANGANAKATDILTLGANYTGSALATKISGIEATSNTASAKATAILNLTADYNGSALANQISQISTTANGAQATATSILNLSASPGSAFMGKINTYDAKLDGLGSATVMEFVANQVGDVTQSAWGVRIEQNVNGVKHVSGVGLLQEIIDGVALSRFNIVADKFAVMPSSTATNAQTVVPFMIDDGKVYINQAIINKASILDLIAGSVVADFVSANTGLRSARISTPEINMGSWTGSISDPASWVYTPYTPAQRAAQNFSVDSGGTLMCKNAVLENATVSGTLVAATGTFAGTLTADALSVLETAIIRGGAVPAQYYLYGVTAAPGGPQTFSKTGFTVPAQALLKSEAVFNVVRAADLPAGNYGVRYWTVSYKVRTTSGETLMSGSVAFEDPDGQSLYPPGQMTSHEFYVERLQLAPTGVAPTGSTTLQLEVSARLSVYRYSYHTADFFFPGYKWEEWESFIDYSMTSALVVTVSYNKQP